MSPCECLCRFRGTFTTNIENRPFRARLPLPLKPACDPGPLLTCTYTACPSEALGKFHSLAKAAAEQGPRGCQTKCLRSQ